MKFSIRDLLLVTVIVAVCVAWWADHRRQQQRLRRVGGFPTHFAKQYGRDIDVDDAGRVNEGRAIVTSVTNSSAPAPKLPSD